jgi:hypothetical protein
MALNLRQYFPFAVPSWLSTGDGGLLLQAVTSLIDIQVQRARDGLEARMPSRAGASALALFGATRGILQGRNETDAHYAARLIGWRYPLGHRVRGNAFALLDQICEYWGGVRCYTTDARATVHLRGATSVASTTYSRDAEAYEYGSSLNFSSWYTEDHAVNWSRFWVVVCVTPEVPAVTAAQDYGDLSLWGGATGTPGYCVGLAGWVPDDTTAMRKLMRPPWAWRPAGTSPEWMIAQVSDWTATAPPPPAPTALWVHWSSNVAGTQTPSRASAFRYISLNPEGNNTYAGDPTNFPEDTYVAGGTIYAGDPALFGLSPALPHGAAYAGEPASFPTSVQLIDDGDQI